MPTRSGAAHTICSIEENSCSTSLHSFYPCLQLRLAHCDRVETACPSAPKHLVALFVCCCPGQASAPSLLPVAAHVSLASMPTALGTCNGLVAPGSSSRSPRAVVLLQLIKGGVARAKGEEEKEKEGTTECKSRLRRACVASLTLLSLSLSSFSFAHRSLET